MILSFLDNKYSRQVGILNLKIILKAKLLWPYQIIDNIKTVNNI